MRNNEVFRNRSLKKYAIICLQMTVIFGVIFILIFQQFTSKGIVYSFIVSGMFSFGLGLGNGFINYYLNTKWDWISQTKQRVTSGIIGTILYTVPIILGINYITWYVLGNNDPSLFLKGSNLYAHFFYIILSLGVATFLHAKDFMINWKLAMTNESTKQEIVAKTETAKFESLKVN